MLRSDCEYAHVDLGLRYPHIPEDTFLHGVSQFFRILRVHTVPWKNNASNPSSTPSVSVTNWIAIMFLDDNCLEGEL